MKKSNVQDGSSKKMQYMNLNIPTKDKNDGGMEFVGCTEFGTQCGQRFRNGIPFDPGSILLALTRSSAACRNRQGE